MDDGADGSDQLMQLLPRGVPCAAPSSAGSRRGKARMFEHMDVRVRAGRRIPSNAGNRHSEGMSARKSGRLSLGYFSLARQREVTRFGRRPKRNALDLALACAETRPHSPARANGNNAPGALLDLAPYADAASIGAEFDRAQAAPSSSAMTSRSRYSK